MLIPQNEQEVQISEHTVKTITEEYQHDDKGILKRIVKTETVTVYVNPANR